MGGDSSYLGILRVVAFLAIVWTGTKISRILGVSSIVAEIALGVAFGPREGIFKLMPPEYAMCYHRQYYNECEAPAGFDDGMGELGLLADFANDCEDHPHEHPHAGHRVLQAELPGGLAHAPADLPDGSGVTARVRATLQECRELLGAAAPVAEEAAQPGDLQGAGAERRLAGGGSDEYGSYGECLVGECKHHVDTNCQLFPDIFTLVGQTGVAMMIFESGMHFDFSMVAKVGPPACVVAVIGTALPLVAGAALLHLAPWGGPGRPLIPDSLAAGTALAPTSVGISLRLLSEAQVLHMEFGQTIMTAAFVDDILSLILFNILFSIGDGTGAITFMDTFFWSVVGVGFMIVATVMAVVFWPCMIQKVLLPCAERIAKLSSDEVDPKLPYKDQALFFLMLCMLLGYATITFVCGTHLWGCFIAGMSFACLEPHGHAHEVWVKQTKRVTSWMIRIFFSCTVAFSIPVTSLISVEAFWKGAIMGAGPCIFTKVVCAIFMGPSRFVIGWAMVGRAEFAYLIAQMALSGGLLDSDTFSIVIWALLWATIFAPFAFKCLLNRYVRKHNVIANDHRHHDRGSAEHDGAKEDSLDALKSQLEAACDRLAKLEGTKPETVAGAKSLTTDLLTRFEKTFALGVAHEDDFRRESMTDVAEVVIEKAEQKAEVGASVAPHAAAAGAGGAADAAPTWEESAVVPMGSEREDMPLTTNNGKGVLCCLFFNKVTMVKPPGP